MAWDKFEKDVASGRHAIFGNIILANTSEINNKIIDYIEKHDREFGASRQGNNEVYLYPQTLGDVSALNARQGSISTRDLIKHIVVGTSNMNDSALIVAIAGNQGTGGINLNNLIRLEYTGGHARTIAKLYQSKGIHKQNGTWDINSPCDISRPNELVQLSEALQILIDKKDNITENTSLGDGWSFDHKQGNTFTIKRNSITRTSMTLKVEINARYCVFR